MHPDGFDVGAKLQIMRSQRPAKVVANFWHCNIAALPADVSIRSGKHTELEDVGYWYVRGGIDVGGEIIDVPGQTERKEVGHARVDEPGVTPNPRTIMADERSHRAGVSGKGFRSLRVVIPVPGAAREKRMAGRRRVVDPSYESVRTNVCRSVEQITRGINAIACRKIVGFRVRTAA